MSRVSANVIAIAALWTVACASPYPAPPATARGDVVDTIHGETVPDPYRWLEAQDDDATRDWIDRQNTYAEEIIGEPALREQLRARLRDLMDVSRIGPTQKGGAFEYFTMRRAGEELPVIYRRTAPEKDGRSSPASRAPVRDLGSPRWLLRAPTGYPKIEKRANPPNPFLGNRMCRTLQR